MSAENETVQSVLANCLHQYDGIVNSNTPVSSAPVQQKIDACITSFSRLLELVDSQGAFSKNEEVDEMSTLSLSLITVPYYMAQLASKRASDGSDHRRRVETLSVSSSMMLKFLNFCEGIRLISEDDIERRVQYHPLDRNTRVEAHRRKRALEEALAQIDGKIRLERAKSRRMRRIRREEAAEEEDEGDNAPKVHDDDEDDDDIPEELIRERHLTFAKMCVEDAFDVIHANTREAEMLGSMTAEEKRVAVERYQESLKMERSHAPNLHFPMTKRPELSDIYLNLTSGVLAGPPTQQPMTGVNYDILDCGHSQPLRQRIREEAFTDRNRPTMTLEEFAQGEMQMMAEQARMQSEGKRLQQEEDDRLGEDGVEERERVKAAAWDDWKDANPANGISSKGNYS